MNRKERIKSKYFKYCYVAFLLFCFSFIYFLPINEIKKVSVATINSNSVNLREAPSIESEIVYKEKAGDKFEILKTSNDWIEVRVNNSPMHMYFIVKDISEDKLSIPTNFYEQKKPFITLFIITS